MKIECDVWDCTRDAVIYDNVDGMYLCSVCHATIQISKEDDKIIEYERGVEKSIQTIDKYKRLLHSL